ncbi:MAG: ribonucleotide reductase N-terminal alpha domain-containing protein [Patescibacteria group bacterium]
MKIIKNMQTSQLITKTVKTNKKSNGHLDPKKVNWDQLAYTEMVDLVTKLAGPRPQLPATLPRNEWTSQAVRVLQERYFLKDENGEVLEDTASMCWRVAWELARAEVKYGRTRDQIIDQAKEYYSLMIKRWFLPNSPTLMNAGKGNGLQYSACYVLPIEDSLPGIFDGIKYQAIVHQSGGGTGFSFSRLRPAGSRVKSTRGVASGPVSFMRIYNEATQQIKQGGMRRGANMGILRVDHPDVLEFIHAKDDGVGITNFNISVTVTDKFMEALAKNEDYELIAPHNGEVVGKLSAKMVWDEIAKGAHKTGDPGVIFIDRINQGPGNPIRKPGWLVESTNPCVTGDTLVETDTGPVSIEELAKIGMANILVDKRLGDKKVYTATKIFENGTKEVYKLTTRKGYEIKLTKDHRLMTPNGWVEVQNLKDGDSLLISDNDVQQDKFSSLDIVGNELVYDLTEPITHSFIANKFISHNCGEQELYPFDACNLGSIFLTYYVKDGDVDWEKLKYTIHTTVRLLDSVIEMNPFPLPQIADTVKQIRRIGLGVGGWADMLVQLGIPYDSDQALELAEKVMKFIKEEGHKASQNLGKERGPFPLYKDSIYKNKPMRNCTVTTIAPTGSIGILAGASGGVEPKFAIAYQHIVKSENRTLTFVDELFEQTAKEKGFWSEELKNKLAEHGTVHGIAEVPEDVRRVWVTAHEIHPDWHVKMQAAFQKYTDNSVSKTINMPNSASVEDIQRAYMLAWKTGCDGITVFRDGCKNEQVLNVGTKSEDKKKEAEKLEMLVEPIKERPLRVTGATYRVDTPVGIAFITINEDEDGHPLELFVNVGKAGSDVTAMAEALGRTISTSLRFRGGLSAKDRAEEIARQLAGIGGRRSVGFGPNKILSLPDAIAYALSIHFGFLINGWNKQKTPVQQLAIDGTSQPTDTLIAAKPAKKLGDICPKCGEASFVFEEGCKKCYSCGHSEC